MEFESDTVSGSPKTVFETFGRQVNGTSTVRSWLTANRPTSTLRATFAVNPWVICSDCRGRFTLFFE